MHKMQKSQGGEDFKIGRPVIVYSADGLTIQGFDSRLDQGDQFGKFIGRARLAVDGNAFFDPIEVRRGKKSGPVARGMNNSGNHRRGRAFAFGSRHVDNRQFVLGIIQLFQKRPHPV